MSGLQKTVLKFLSKQNDITINDVTRLLEGFGYKPRKKPGSEIAFHKKGGYPITVPTIRGRKVKVEYVRRLIKILELEEWFEKHKGC